MDSLYQQNNPFDNNNDPSRINNDDEFNKNHSNKGKGRKKIPMEKIKSETNRQVTFSKRRAGLFKKASELHTLCGGDNAIVVLSPSGKAHSFAAPNIETITDQFLNPTALGRTRFNRMPSDNDDPITRQGNTDLTNLERQLEEEKRKKKEHARTRKVKMNQIEYPPNIDLFDLNQLQALKDNLVGLKNDLTTTKDASSNERGSGPGVRYPMDLNIQGPPSYNNKAAKFYKRNNGTMLNDISPFVPDDGSINYPAMFDFIVNNKNNSNNKNNNNTNVGYRNDANNTNPNDAIFFPGMVTINHGYFDQTVNKNNYVYHIPPRPNDHQVGGSSSLMTFTNEDVPNQDGEYVKARRGVANSYGRFNNYNGFGYGI